MLLELLAAFAVARAALPDGTSDTDALYRNCKASVLFNDLAARPDRLDSAQLTPTDLAMAARCDGYIDGVVAGYLITISGTGQPSKVCRSGDDVSARSARAVVAFIESHPSKVKYGAASAVLRALAEAYPCDEQE